MFQKISGEEVSVSLVYALGLWTDQTPPICASKRNTAGKGKTEWVPEKVNLGKQARGQDQKRKGPNATKIKAATDTMSNQTRSGGMKP